ncbi:MAG: T9SS type A sorting domain-containing protein [Bacteroidales bacterium]|nr:T9SS type A sorting domain-containing protein [Bacteroidales bacterium]
MIQFFVADKLRIIVLYILCNLPVYPLLSQIPVLKVDLNVTGRQENEVNEPGYIPWPISGPGSKSIEGVLFEFKNGKVDDGWYKAGAQAPNYARLVSDGFRTDKVELYITGLEDGKHCLVTFHNAFDNPENTVFSPVDIYVNKSLVIDNLEPSLRALSNDACATAYIEFEVINSQPVVMRFQSDPKPSSTTNVIHVCGFHLNSSDPKRMARFEYPKNKDEHVNIDNDTLVFYWKPPVNTLNHNVYFSTDELEVQLANPDSPAFAGNMADTFFIRSGFHNMADYYWRIDPIDITGDTAKGDVWHFKKRIPSFPGAEGYGRYAIGGRGGKVVYVTNLEDSGPGSFRYAVENDFGPRTIVFAVSGLITLNSRLNISDDYIAVAGQTAPGKGICFRWNTIGVTGDDVIVQHVRLRMGMSESSDGMGLTGAESSIIDHCSISWSIDEAFSSRNAKNITLQRTLVSEALNEAGHPNYPSGSQHGFAASIGGDIGSFHHNLLAHCNGRNWSLAGGLNGDGFFAGKLDIFNNLVYNWGYRATDGGAHEVNFVNNYYKPGISTTQFTALNAQYENDFPGSQQYYFAGNVMPGHFDISSQIIGRKASGDYIPKTYQPFVDIPFFDSDATIHSAQQAYKLVLSDVGCTQPIVDDHDIRIINETLSGSYTYSGSKTGKKGFPDSETDVGGWEAYPGYLRSPGWDTDFDGLPDWWEKSHGLNTNSAAGDFSESNADEERNGYTNLEEYLQWMSKPHYFLQHNNDSLDIDLSQFTRGFENSPVHAIKNVVNGTVKTHNNTSLVSFKPCAEGLAEIDFKVTDAEGDSLIQRIGIYIGEVPKDSMFTYSYKQSWTGSAIVTVDSVNRADPGVSNIRITNSGVFNISVFPNPANRLLNVNLELNRNPYAVLSIIDITGRVLMEEKHWQSIPLNPVSIDISVLTPGIYMLNIRNEEINKMVRFIKE